MACPNFIHSPCFSTTTTLRQDATSSFNRSFIFSSNYSYRPLVVKAQAKRGGIIQKDVLEELATADDLKFEAPLEIVLYPDPRLRAKNKRVATFDDNLKNLADEMFNVMYNFSPRIVEYEQYFSGLLVHRTDGIGLSAPQVGINVQLMVFNPVGERGEGEEIVLVNPKVIKYSKKVAPFTEGCLSFPGINADVVRPEIVKVDAQDITGANFTLSLSRLPSRVFQHEFDHLEGILFFDRMTAEVVESIRTQLMELEQKYEDRTGLTRPESVQTRKRWTAAAGFGRS
ncbi:peptide deformylase 1B, chloroplastic/mitochondrial [Tanacetum coccineum]